MNVAIVTDSNSGIFEQEGKILGVHVIPMPVILDEKTYYEGRDLSHREFFQLLEEGRHVSSSQPSLEDIKETWEKLFEEGYEEIVHIPMSSGLSGSFQSARMLARKYDGRVQVADNHRISVPQAQSVYDAKVLAETIDNGSQIKETLEKESLDASIYIAVDTLEYLKKGGRITPAAAAVGTVLNLKPVLTIQGDKLDACTKTRGMKAAFKAMCKAVEKDIQTRFADLHSQGLLKTGIATTFTDPEKLSYFQEEMRNHFPDMELLSAPLTMSIGCHTGPGALGIGVFRAHV